MNRVQEWQHLIRSTAGEIESLLIDGVSSIAPWLAPIPSAYLVSRATIAHFGWGPSMGVITALIIESIGISTINTALMFHNYNQTRRKTDNPAPFFLAVILVGVYLTVTIGLTVLLDIFPILAQFSKVIFAVIASLGGLNLGLRSSHKNILKTIADEKNERKEKRQETRPVNHSTYVNESSTSVLRNVSNNGTSNDFLNKMESGRQAKIDRKLDETINVFRPNPRMAISDAARLVGVSRTTMYGYLDMLEENGRIHRNGTGVEIIK